MKMSNKPKIVVFGVSFWKDEKHWLYDEWKGRINKYIGPDEVFITPGSYSDPSKISDGTPVIQIGIQNTKDYSKNWSYYHVGFLTGIYHLLLNIKEFDIAIHVQDSTLINTDIRPHINEFLSRDEIFAAPKFSSEMGTYVETAFMMMKRPAVEQYATSPMRPSLSDEELLNVEEEAFFMFKDSWWNFLPEVLTIRKIDDTILEDEGSPFDLSEEEFYELPILLASHCKSKKVVSSWISENPL